MKNPVQVENVGCSEIVIEKLDLQKTKKIKFYECFHRKAQTHVAARVDHCKIFVNVAEHAVDLRQNLIVVLQMCLGARETIN